jgi:hypothetical protein
MRVNPLAGRNNDEIFLEPRIFEALERFLLDRYLDVKLAVSCPVNTFLQLSTEVHSIQARVEVIIHQFLQCFILPHVFLAIQNHIYNFLVNLK